MFQVKMPLCAILSSDMRRGCRIGRLSATLTRRRRNVTRSPTAEATVRAQAKPLARPGAVGIIIDVFLLIDIGA